MYNLEKLNELGIESLSIEAYGRRYCVENIYDEFEEWIENQDDDQYMINVWIDIYGNTKECTEKILIGKISGNFFESDEDRDYRNFLELCDSISTDLEHMAESIVDEEGDVKREICESYENIMYIDRVYIEDKYRGLGIASFVIKNLNNILKYTSKLNPHVLILLPNPQEKDENGFLSEVKNDRERKKQYENLVSFYKKLGFNNIDDSEYMIKRTINLDDFDLDDKLI